MPRHSLGSCWVLHYIGKFILAEECGIGWKQEEAGVRETREEGSYCKYTGTLLFSHLIIYRQSSLMMYRECSTVHISYRYALQWGFLYFFQPEKQGTEKLRLCMNVSCSSLTLPNLQIGPWIRTLRKITEGWGGRMKEKITNIPGVLSLNRPLHIQHTELLILPRTTTNKTSGAKPTHQIKKQNQSWDILRITDQATFSYHLLKCCVLKPNACRSHGWTLWITTGRTHGTKENEDVQHCLEVDKQLHLICPHYYKSQCFRWTLFFPQYRLQTC